MNLDLLNYEVRKTVLADIKSYENIYRKRESYIDFEIYNDRIHKYVFDEIVRQTSIKTAQSMPIVSSINLAQRIVNNEATIYNNDPERTTDLNDADQKAIDAVYDDGQFNTKLQKVNKYFKYRKQSFIQIVPKDKGITLRPLLSHHLDVIPDELDPEKAYAYIVSAFDKQLFQQSDGRNQSIADQDDYKASLERYVVWTAEYNFIMNGKGEIISEILKNEIGELPFVDVSKDKDFEFFNRQGQTLSDFTVQYNAAWSDFLYISRLQGFSLGIFTGNSELMPKDYFVGPNRFIFLPSDPNNPNSKVDFRFESPSPDLKGSLEGISGLLSNFLTSRGLSPKVISSDLNAKDTYASGVERLLAMIDKFEATKEDFDMFKNVESQIYDVVVKYLVALSNTEFLDKEYWISQSALTSEFNVVFHKPEMIQTEAEKLSNLKLKIDLGISDKVLALMDLESISEEMATQKIDEIIARKSEAMATVQLAQPNQPLMITQGAPGIGEKVPPVNPVGVVSAN